MAQKINDYANEPVVVIKPKAYLSMLKHVLNYGNEFLTESVEVMGICYGAIEGGKIIQYEAVPISHGGAIEVDFAPEDYAAFAMVDEQMSEKGYFAVGWYHSHPGLEAFLSKVDIKNHLFYQKEQTPHAYAIVFDHTYFNRGEPNIALGFKAYRLNDIKRGVHSDYHEIKYEVEPPDDLSYYSEVQSIIESLQTKKPIIKEAREGLDDLGVWEEESDEATESEEGPKDPFKDIKQGLDEGLNGIKNSLFAPMLDTFQIFSADTESAALKGPKVMIKALEEMRDSISSGLGRVKTYFEKALEKEIVDVTASIDSSIKEYVKGQLEIPKKTQSVVDNVSTSLSKIIGNQLENSLSGILGKFKGILDTAQDLANKQTQFTGIIDKQGEAITSFAQNVKSNMDALNQSAGTVPKQISASVSKKTDSVKTSLDDIKKNNNEIKKLIDDLSKVVMSKRK
jgi:proteasome lid subunit RPN8/RPN11/uncharacterized protein YoxC